MSAILERTVPRAEARKLDAILNPFEAARKYLSEHRDRLLEKYEDEWVAIGQKGLVAHDESRAALLRQLRRMGRRTNSVHVEFLTRKRRTLVL